MRRLAKLDCYEYYVLPGIIQIQLTATNDPSLVDILSEIENANGNLYLDGHYYIMVGYNIVSASGEVYLELSVSKTE